MHYPSDVAAGAALGAALGSLVPGLGAPPTEERLFDLAAAANERAPTNGEVAVGAGVPDPDARG
jgi:membrane-associated phospholipid phosphatase